MKKTLSSQFRTSLDMLMRTLNACHPFFVRCIKPNEYKKPQIRQAGYPIRYSYIEFVDRFRYLAKAIPTSAKGDCRNSAEKICRAALEGDSDYQFGNTKVFLKHSDNEKGWICRRRYLRLRAAAIISSILSNQLRDVFKNIRNNVIRLQALSKGYLERKNGQMGRIVCIIRQRKSDEEELKSHGIKNYRSEATKLMQARLAEVNKEYAERLRKMEEENERARKIEIPGTPDDLNKDADSLDLQEYTFRKFAATYFISSLNYQHQRKPPKDALLQLPTPDDVLASQALYITIMRFMGDYPETKEAASDMDRTPVMSKVSQTIGRSFVNRKEYQKKRKCQL
ncbi:unnamed protein product [Callosobruchus maculatus]|uniref:Uncharacterized protein n=1 Tax=Callosobruchus maculatus TaxID=64391 RepID=A0A653DSG9_CALMS|nr:unnamed protein product [Callosobruchus maculatus]